MNTATKKREITTSPITFTDLEPGKRFGPIRIEIVNTGTMNIRYLAISWELNGGNPISPRSNAWKLADNIIVTGMREYSPGSGWLNELGYRQNFHLSVEDGEYLFTLLELAQSYSIGRDEPYEESGEGHYELDQFGKYKRHRSDAVTGGGYDATPGPAIVVGRTYVMVLWFKVSETAGDDLLGKSISLQVKFLGMRDLASRARPIEW